MPAMEESCFLCGKTGKDVAEYLESMLKECQGKSFEGLYYGPFQHCLNSMKSLMFLNRKLEQRYEKLENTRKRVEDIEAQLAGLDPRSKTAQSLNTDLKRIRPQIDMVQKEIDEMELDAGRKQRIVDEFLDVKMEPYQTKSGYIIKLCPVCMSLVKEATYAGKNGDGQ